MAEKWENSLLGIGSLARKLMEKSKLRHGLHWIKASDIGEQYYCEQKVRLSYELGEIETEDTVRGKAMHDKLVEDLKKVSVKEGIKQIKKKKVYGFSGFPIFTKIEGIPLAGILDDVLFCEARPVLVADLKTTSRPSFWPGRNKFVQVCTYGLGLDYMGFDCSKLRLMIGVEHSDIREELGYSPYEQDLYLLLSKAREIEEVEKIETGEGYRRLIYDYNKGQALDDFKRASKYWLGERDAVPTKIRRKCEACVYREDCSKCITEIINLCGIGLVRARKLTSTGLNTIEKIRETPLEQIVKAEIPPKVAWKARLSARALNDDEWFQIENFRHPEEPIYLDVETTPVHRFMTGTYYPEENEFKQFTVRNWNDAGERRRVGKSIHDYLKERSKTIVTFTKYDLKFIPQKIRQSKAHYDLCYRVRRSFVLPTTDYKLSSVGRVFGYQWRNPELTGLDMPRLYSDFLESGDDESLDLIKQHNKDDVMAMFHIVEKIEGQEFNRVKFERSEYEHLYPYVERRIKVEPEPARFESERQRNLRRDPVELVENKSSYRRILEIVRDKPVRRSKLSERLGVKRSTLRKYLGDLRSAGLTKVDVSGKPLNALVKITEKGKVVESKIRSEK